MSNLMRQTVSRLLPKYLSLGIANSSDPVGMTYNELSEFGTYYPEHWFGILPNLLLSDLQIQALTPTGTLRKVHKLGPYGMWEHLVHKWGPEISPRKVYEKVRFF